ncbi:MAG: T9SS type A sorting domain-containing protein [Saprospiraceae bacterium]|nr:T9SS type A sorting domain-containing protein [Saprospiraceae bacterium]
MRQLLILLKTAICLTGMVASLNAQVVIHEIASNGQIELLNTGTDDVDMQEWWIYNTPISLKLSDLPIECGSLVLQSGQVVVVNAVTFYARTSGELGLFSTNSFGNGDALVDYVIWGNRAGNTSESIAVGKGEWVDGERAPGFAANQSLQYDRLGNSAENWSASAPSLCEEVDPCLSVAGSITFADGTLSKFICSGNGIADPLEVAVEGNVGDTVYWIVTDLDNTILAIPTSQPIDLEGAPGGTCLIYHASAIDSIRNLQVGNTLDDLRGCFALSNSLSVIRDGVDGGVLVTDDGIDRISICIGEGVIDSVNVNMSGQVGDTSIWIVTDSDRMILGLPRPPPFNLEASGDNEWLVWVVSYNGSIDGLIAGAPLDSLRGGCFDLSNPVSVFRNVGLERSEGGEIMTSDSITEFTICSGDGIPDPFDVLLDGASGTNSDWIITDTSGLIIAMPNAPPFDLEGAPPGTCLVWHISYGEGLMGLEEGGNIFMLQGGCSDLSNPITVHRQGVGAGLLSFADGMTEATICAGDNNPNPLDVMLSANGGTDSLWLFTDADSIVIGVPIAPPFDLDRAGPGRCLIWHVGHNGDLSFVSNGTHVNELNGCYGVSNALVVNRIGVDGGTLLTSDSLRSLTICAGDDKPDPIDVVSYEVSGSNALWLITDADSMILAQPPGPPFDLDAAGFGVCLIWHMRFEGNIFGNDVGNHLNQLNGCLSLSNPIEVQRDTAGITCETTSTYGSELISKIAVYPNPISDQLTIEKQVGTGQTYLLFDILGRPLWTARLRAEEITARVRLDDLSPGVYILQVKELSGGTDAIILLKE